MDVKDIFKFLSQPLILGAVGGYLGHRYGKDRFGRWAAVGGAAGGYLIGNMVQKQYFGAGAPPLPQSSQQELMPTGPVGEYVDFSVQPSAQPVHMLPPASAATAARQAHTARKEALAEQVSRLDNGSLGGGGKNGLGSYEPNYTSDEEVDTALAEMAAEMGKSDLN